MSSAVNCSQQRKKEKRSAARSVSTGGRVTRRNYNIYEFAIIAISALISWNIGHGRYTYGGRGRIELPASGIV